MPHAPQVVLADLLRLLVRVRANAAHHVGEVVRGGLVAGLGGVLAVGVVQAYRGVHRHQKRGVGVAVLRRPHDSLRAARARHPDRRVRLLHRQHPGVDDPEVVMGAFPAKRPGPRPGGQHEVVAFLEALAVVVRDVVVGPRLDADAAHYPGDDPAAGNYVRHGHLFGKAHRVVGRR